MNTGSDDAARNPIPDSKRQEGLVIRHATESDLDAINLVSNHYIEATHITFDLEPYSSAKRREWFAGFSDTGRYQAFRIAAVVGRTFE